MNILITGANGFLGSWLCRYASSIEGVKIFAAVRKNADSEKLKSIVNLEIVTFDYSSETTILEKLQTIKEKTKSIDLVIHNAGLTKSTNRSAFIEINEGITSKLTNALIQSKLLTSGTFSYVSSQAAIGPLNCGGPVSVYGESKLRAEEQIIKFGLNYMIFRPTGIYGPGDKEFLPLFKSVKTGIYPCAAPIDQKITLIHVFDVAKNIIDLSLKLTNKTIHLSDGHIYSHFDLKKAIEKAINKKSIIVQVPMLITKYYLILIEFLGNILGFEPLLTEEKHSEISKDWDHDFSLERKEIPLEIKFNLENGFADTSAYYKSQKLL